MTAESDPPDFKSPVDLAREADFSLGALRVSPSTREVLRGADRESLEPRVMQVLVALFQANGRVVSRDELISRCWEGRIVGEDAINRAIGRLRRLSEGDGEASFVIETIPRVGFRLMASQKLVAAETGSGLAVVEAKNGGITPALTAPGPLSHRRDLRLVAGLALLAVAAFALAAWLWRPEPHWTVESSRPFISTLALEDEPAFSPDGKILAYTSGPDGGKRQIYVRNLAAGEGIKIAGDGYDDISPSWSSDGARLAYVAVNSGEPCRIMVATFPAGEAHEAGRCDHADYSTVTWQPGTPFVYSIENGGSKGHTLFRLNLDTGERRVIVATRAMRDYITSLQCSPDGKWLTYLIAGRQIIIRDLASGREKALGSVSEQGSWNILLAWTEDSGTVLAGTSGFVGGSEIIAHPISGGAPYSVYATAAKIRNFATGGGLLALGTDIRRMSLARASASPTTQPDIIDPASGITWSPSFAPDGTLAFLSSRSGSNAVWLMKPGAAPVLLFDGGFSVMDRVRFSPDGTKLAVASETTKIATVKIINRDGATLTSIDMPSLGLGLPGWTPDGKAVLVFDRHVLRTMRIALDNIAQHIPFAPPHWVGIAVRKDGTFAFRADRPGIWRIDGGIKQINSSYHSGYPPLAFRGDDVLVPEYNLGSTPRILAQPVAGGPSRAIAYAPGGQGDLAVNPATGEIVYIAQVSRDTNIDLLTLARR
jgi:Tol biopolymer transport system component/DNA-binding winged helix-turn-helix (wHTH) protein